MRHQTHYDHSNNGHTLLAFLAGAATASALGGYYLYGPHGRDNHEKLARWTRRAKHEILKKMEEIGDVTEEGYATIVDEVTDRYAQMSHVGKEKASEAAQMFKEKWEDMRDMVAEAREEAEREIANKERQNTETTSERMTLP